ncbi:MAG: DUF6020 family protein [Coriobacteriales bacterium]|nr:DUF6020 family protein [Coriobacteriales bacterium]
MATEDIAEKGGAPDRGNLPVAGDLPAADGRPARDECPTPGRRRLQPSALVLALLFALATVAGQLFTDNYPSLLQLFSDGARSVAAVALTALLTTAFYLLLSKAFAFVEARSAGSGPQCMGRPLRCERRMRHGRASGQAQRATRPQRPSKLNPLLIYAGIILIFWLPYFVILFPGNVYSDAFRMIQDVKDPDFSSWHALFPSLLLNALWDIGSGLGSALFKSGTAAHNTGIFLIIVLEAALLLAAFLCLLAQMQRLGIKRRGCVITAAFFGLVPLFATFACTVWADAFYLACFALFQIRVVEIYCNRSRIAVRTLILTVLLALLLSLLRKEGVFVCLVSVAALLLAVHSHERLKIVAAKAALLVCYCAAAAAGLTSTNTPPGSTSEEMMSIPMQQTARTLSLYPDDVTPEEMATINKVFIWYSDIPIAEKYSQWTADNIKGFGTSVPTEDIVAYLQVWAGMGLRHPDVYLDSLVASSYGYYSPLSWRDQYGTGPFEIIRADSYAPGVYNDVFAFEPDYVLPGAVRDALYDYAHFWRNVPVFSWLATPGAFVWLLGFAATLLIRARKASALVVFVPCCMVFLICVAGPVNGFARYAAPIMACAPLLLAFSYKVLWDKGTAKASYI